MTKIIDEYLPRTCYSKLSWLVSEECEIYATDGLRVCKIAKERLVWITKRISYDEVNLLKITEKEILGQWYNPLDEQSPWNDLIISVGDGSIIKGDVIEFQ